MDFILHIGQDENTFDSAETFQSKLEDLKEEIAAE